MDDIRLKLFQNFSEFPKSPNIGGLKEGAISGNRPETPIVRLVVLRTVSDVRFTGGRGHQARIVPSLSQFVTKGKRQNFSSPHGNPIVIQQQDAHPHLTPLVKRLSDEVLFPVLHQGLSNAAFDGNPWFKPQFPFGFFK
jgi:hypothetical protein